GLIREGEGIAAGVLESLGLTLEKVRRQTVTVLSQLNKAPLDDQHTSTSTEPGVSTPDQESETQGNGAEKPGTSDRVSARPRRERDSVDKFRQWSRKDRGEAKEE